MTRSDLPCLRGHDTRFPQQKPIRRFRHVAPLAAVLICLSSWPARGATLYVSTTGDDANTGASPKLAWRTITHAAKTARAGDLVRIKGGDYGHENVVVANSGTPEAPIRFEGYDGDVRLEGIVKKAEGKPVRLEGHGVLIGEKAHVRLSGITTLKYRDGIVVRGSHDVTVERCTAGICGWSGIMLLDSHHCEVKHCTAYNVEMVNFWVGKSHDCVVADCWSYCDPRLDPYTDYCYGVSNARSIHVTRCRGDGKLRSGHGICFTVGGGGPESHGCQNCRVTDCEMYNCWELFGVRHKGHDITFENCYGQGKIMDTLESRGREIPAWCKQSYNWYNHGFYFRTGAHDILVKNCRVRGVRIGLHADDAGGRYKEWGVTGNISFENCIATECITGIRTNAPNVKVLNCISARNKHGLMIGNGPGQSIKGCIICWNAVGIRSGTPTKTPVTRCNLWGNQKDLSGKVDLAADCISKDPQFVNVSIPGTFPSQEAEKRLPGPDYDDWHVKDASPCNDMGPYADDPKASVGMR